MEIFDADASCCSGPSLVESFLLLLSLRQKIDRCIESKRKTVSRERGSSEVDDDGEM
jgi:hypothetical protein